MKRLVLSLFLVLLAAFLSPAPSAQAQGGGTLIKTFDLKASKLLLDPARPQLYATLPNDNSLAVLDTNTNTVVATFYVGSQPIDLDISPDGTRLYVLNGGSTAAGIGVVDLTSLTLISSLAVPRLGVTLVAGLGNRLYVQGKLPILGADNNIVQIDAATGASQEPFPDSGNSELLVISPDKKTLFAAGDGLASYDVSTATPSLLQTAPMDPFSSLTISPDGQYLTALNDDDTTSLISAANLTDTIGKFATGHFPGVATFSADASLLYQVQIGGADNDAGSGVLKIFSTQSFALLSSFDLPDTAGSSFPDYTSLAVTSPNGYLYVASSSDPYGADLTDLMLVSTRNAPFFDGAVPLSDGFYYLQFPDRNFFGYYNFNDSPYLFHIDLQFEYPFDAADGAGGIYLYDFASQTFFYTSSTLFPYLYDFTLHTFLYYFPNTRLTDHYTAYPRYFYDFADGRIITK